MIQNYLLLKLLIISKQHISCGTSYLVFFGVSLSLFAYNNLLSELWYACGISVDKEKNNLM